MLKSDKLNAWTRVQVQECSYQVRHCTTDLAQEHGLREANRRASSRSGRRTTVVRVLLSATVFTLEDLHLVGLAGGR